MVTLEHVTELVTFFLACNERIGAELWINLLLLYHIEYLSIHWGIFTGYCIGLERSDCYEILSNYELGKQRAKKIVKYAKNNEKKNLIY